jgi:hypothetical protein
MKSKFSSVRHLAAGFNARVMAWLGGALLLFPVVLAAQITNTLLEDFESYATGSWPSPMWTPDANAFDTANSKIVLDPEGAGDKTLKLYGPVGSCWSANAYREHPFPSSFYIDCDIRNGTETLSGCHPDRAMIGMLHGTWWINYGRALITFGGDNTIRADGDILGAYQTGKWYHVQIKYERAGAQLKLTYWLDRVQVGQVQRTISDASAEDGLDHIQLLAEEGSVWFDNLKVTPPAASDRVAVVNPDHFRILKMGFRDDTGTFYSIASAFHGDTPFITTNWTGVGTMPDFIGSLLQRSGVAVDYFEATNLPAVSSADYAAMIIEDPLRTNARAFANSAENDLPDLLEYCTNATFLGKLSNYVNSGGNLVLVGDAVRLLEDGEGRLNYGKTVTANSVPNQVTQADPRLPSHWLFIRGNPFCGVDRSGFGTYDATSGILLTPGSRIQNISLFDGNDLPYALAWSDSVYSPTDGVSLLDVQFGGTGEYVLDGNQCNPPVYQAVVEAIIPKFMGFTTYNGNRIYYVGSDSLFDYACTNNNGAWHSGQAETIQNSTTTAAETALLRLVSMAANPLRGVATASNNIVTITFPSIAGGRYRVESTTDVKGGSWPTVIMDNIVGTGNTIQITDNGASSRPRSIYRVVLTSFL